MKKIQWMQGLSSFLITLSVIVVADSGCFLFIGEPELPESLKNLE